MQIVTSPPKYDSNWLNVFCYLENFEINIINKHINNWLQLVFYKSFVSANNGDYFSIT